MFSERYEGFHRARIGLSRATIARSSRGESERGRVGVTSGADDTNSAEYTRRLLELQGQRWKRVLDVQAPYRWNLRRLQLGFTLDLGCGIGRTLVNLGGNGVGVDHNPESVNICRARGLSAFTPEQFRASEYGVTASFDSLLLSHVIEHMTELEAKQLVGEYVGDIKPGGLLVLITPQEVGYRSDSTHVHFADFQVNAAVCESLGAHVVRQYSFPFPRFVGRIFIYNEFITVARLPA